MIRRFRSGDQKGIALLEAECFSHPWSEEAIVESHINSVIFLVFEEEGKIKGYVGMQKVLDEGYITNIAVTQSERKKGIGIRLIESLKKVAKEENLRFISLEVRKTNLAAISLYKKMGFKEKGIRKNFYTAPVEDGIIMTLEEIE